MLVCPQCQFENPENHRFCQACGASLTHLDCPACGAMVERSAEHCPDCGAMTGQLWRAVILPRSSEHSHAEPATGVGSLAALLKTAPEKYLDPQQRYKLRSAFPQAAISETGLEVTVLDLQPLQSSGLLVLESAEDSEPPAEGAAAEIPAIAEVPSPAQPYLALEAEMFPALPHLHDAWEGEDYTVLLLEDRAYLPSLVDRWGNEAIVPLQMIRWLHDLTELWAALEPWDCCQSLLELDNLCTDEDQILCLRRLYADHPDQPPTLQNLGKLWQYLFQRSQRTFFASLANLCLDLEMGRVDTIDELRSHLSAIADELQPNSVAHATMMPDSSFDSAMTDGVSMNDLTPVPPPDLASPPPSKTVPGHVRQPSTHPVATTPVSADFGLSSSSTQLETAAFSEPVTEEDDSSSESDDAPTIVLPMRLLAIEDGGCTDVGQQRDHNEDSFSIELDLNKIETPAGRTLHAKGLYILCDGMGGHAGGEIASALAVDVLREYFETHWTNQLPPEEQVREAIQLANKAIFDENQQNDRMGSGRMGTTLVMVLLQDTQAVVAHVGDSRLYRFSRRLGLQQVTVDHEVGQREIQRGVEPLIAYARPDAYQLTQALGPRDEKFINPDVEYLDLNEDSLLILCSDGLSDNDLLENHCRTHIEPLLSSQTNLEQGARQLIDLANQYNGHDNITAIVIRVKVRPKLEHLK